MTDSEIIRLCADACGIKPDESLIKSVNYDYALSHSGYDPLQDDAQCFALVKKFNIALGWNHPGWAAFRQDIKKWVEDTDLNRAICLCVANMQQATAK